MGDNNEEGFNLIRAEYGLYRRLGRYGFQMVCIYYRWLNLVAR